MGIKIKWTNETIYLAPERPPPNPTIGRDPVCNMFPWLRDDLNSSKLKPNASRSRWKLLSSIRSTANSSENSKFIWVWVYERNDRRSPLVIPVKEISGPRALVWSLNWYCRWGVCLVIFSSPYCSCSEIRCKLRRSVQRIWSVRVLKWQETVTDESEIMSDLKIWRRMTIVEISSSLLITYSSSGVYLC